MQSSDSTLEPYITWFFLLFAAVMAMIIAFRLIAWRKTKGRFPKIPPEAVRFEEWTASGSSHKTAFTRLARARNCLRITVTDEEVWIRPFFPFVLIAPELDLLHRIPRASITQVQPKEGSLYRTIILEYRDEQGVTHRLGLDLKNPEGFLRALVSVRTG